MKNKKTLDLITQFAIPSLTIATQIAIAFKYPQWGLIINMLAQPFWIYSGWKAYKYAGQTGLFITTIIITLVIGYGIFNYWVL